MALLTAKVDISSAEAAITKGRFGTTLLRAKERLSIKAKIIPIQGNGLVIYLTDRVSRSGKTVRYIEANFLMALSMAKAVISSLTV